VNFVCCPTIPPIEPHAQCFPKKERKEETPIHATQNPVLDIAASEKKTVVPKETSLSVQQQGSTSLLADLLDLALPPRVCLEKGKTAAC
jgi:hypothetical protein